MVDNANMNYQVNLEIENENTSKYLVMKLDQYYFGIEVSSVTDVLFPQKITFIPLAPSFVLGAFNLRGQIVTVLDLRILLDLENKNTDLSSSGMVVIKKDEELICFVVDQANHVVDVDLSATKDIPGNIPAQIRNVTDSISFFNEELLLILNKEKTIGSIYG